MSVIVPMVFASESRIVAESDWKGEIDEGNVPEAFVSPKPTLILPETEESVAVWVSA